MTEFSFLDELSLLVLRFVIAIAMQESIQNTTKHIQTLVKHLHT